MLPGGAAYGAWLAQLPKLRELAARVCCKPVPKDSYVEEKKTTAASACPTWPGWLLGTDVSDLGLLLALLGAIPAPQAAATVGRLRPVVREALRAAVPGPAPASGPSPAPAPAPGPAPAPAPDPELADLRDRLAAMTARLAVLESRLEPPAPVRGPRSSARGGS